MLGWAAISPNELRKDTNMLRRGGLRVMRPMLCPYQKPCQKLFRLMVQTAMRAGSSADIRDNVVTNVPSVATNVPPADQDREAPGNVIVIEPPGTQTGAGYGMDLVLVDKKDRTV